MFRKIAASTENENNTYTVICINVPRLTFGHFLDDNQTLFCTLCSWKVPMKCFSQNSEWTVEETQRLPLKWPFICGFSGYNVLLLCIQFYNAHRVRVILILSESHVCPAPHSFSLLFILHIYFFVHHFVALLMNVKFPYTSWICFSISFLPSSASWITYLWIRQCIVAAVWHEPQWIQFQPLNFLITPRWIRSLQSILHHIRSLA